jgi:hypothetical protein
MPSGIAIKISDISTVIESHHGSLKFETPAAYQPFISDDQANFYLGLHSDFPKIDLGEKIFSSPPIWSLYRNGGTSLIRIFDQHADLQRLLVLPPGFRRAELHFTAPDGQFVDPFFGPTMELLMINYLARGHGVVIHACGIEYDGKGMLFAGESGAGKSTLANLWNQQDGAAVLSDDRTIVRKIDGEIWMFGTPWHGEAQFGSPRGIKLENIFFLQHGKKNALRHSSPADTVMKLLQCSFPTYWDAAGMAFTMALFEGLATRISCSDLRFLPDEKVVEMLKGGG